MKRGNGKRGGGKGSKFKRGDGKMDNGKGVTERKKEVNEKEVI